MTGSCERLSFSDLADLDAELNENCEEVIAFLKRQKVVDWKTLIVDVRAFVSSRSVENDCFRLCARLSVCLRQAMNVCFAAEETTES
jgi:hypothetical protein